MFVVTCNWFSPGLPEGLFPSSEVEHGIHGGAIETSMMLHLRPDQVRQGERRKFDSLSIEMAQEFKYLTPEGKVGFGWQTQDLNLFGACGDATDADAPEAPLWSTMRPGASSSFWARSTASRSTRYATACSG